MNFGEFFGTVFAILAAIIIFGVPFFVSIANLFFIFRINPEGKLKKLQIISEILTWVFGPMLSIMLLSFSNVIFEDYTAQLYNSELHSPVASWHLATLMVFCTIGAICYFLLRIISIKDLPPLITVFSISGMYMGIFVLLLWIIQIFYTPFGKMPSYLMMLIVFPVNCIFLTVARVRTIITDWKNIQEKQLSIYRLSILNRLNEKLINANKWPLYALIAFVPLIALTISILVLFGQKPDAVIKAFTETSDWNLSTKVAPQNIYHDEHYLCTVAAGGHRKVVKPLRKGLRHGHEVTVNRQLCIANAFEQILEERTPGFHKAVRGFYDKYGFPVARLIKSKYTADFIYIIMKPLEWFFLFILYLTDVNPENRIAVQYTK